MRKMLPVATLAAAALTLAACSGGGDSEGGGDTTELRVAFNQTEDHPQYIALTNMGERLEEATDGRYTIKVYPNETLGAQQEAIQLLQDGSIELAMVGGAQLENFSEDFVVWNLPMVFDSEEHQREVVNDPDITEELYSELEDQNISVLAGMDGGVRNVYNSDHPVVEPSDLDGLKIRVQESDTHIDMFNLLGAQSTPMAQGEVYTALQSGVLDAAENNELVYYDLKHSEVAKYYSYTRHLMVPDYFIANPDVLDAMSDEDREAFMTEMDAAVDEEYELFDEKVDEAIESAKEQGAKFNDDVDHEAFAEILRPFSEDHVPDSDLAQQIYEDTLAAADD